MVFLAKKIGNFTAGDILMIFPILLGLFIIAAIVYGVIKKRQEAENNAQPVQSADAIIVDKQKIEPNTIAFETWVLFETEEGKRMRLICKANNDYVVGDKGYLKWQGTRLFSFERGKKAPSAANSQYDPAKLAYRATPQPQDKIPAWKQVEMENQAKQRNQN